MNAADYYGLDELRRSCVGFVQCCINVDTVCALLASAERYIQYKCTKSLVQKVRILLAQWFFPLAIKYFSLKVLEFVDEHGNEGHEIYILSVLIHAKFSISVLSIESGIVHFVAATRRSSSTLSRRTQSGWIHKIPGLKFYGNLL